MRTRISDDRLWLPYVAGRYLAVTGDPAILDETVPFIEGPQLGAGQEDAYFQPERSRRSRRPCTSTARGRSTSSLGVGAHGLPLMGTGDWNDGMNRVGQDGRGESVWLGWFLHRVIGEFAPIAEARGERQRAPRWRAHAASSGRPWSGTAGTATGTAAPSSTTARRSGPP